MWGVPPIWKGRPGRISAKAATFKNAVPPLPVEAPPKRPTNKQLDVAFACICFWEVVGGFGLGSCCRRRVVPSSLQLVW
jgi:hypothetical protein